MARRISAVADPEIRHRRISHHLDPQTASAGTARRRNFATTRALDEREIRRLSPVTATYADAAFRNCPNITTRNGANHSVEFTTFSYAAPNR